MENLNIREQELLFVTFCIEMYARRKGISGEQALRKFDSLGV